MDIKEAINIIGLPKTASIDEFKIKYRELAKAYHPDVYKEDPEKFKKINEAYQLIQDYKSNPDKYDKPQSPFRRVQVDGFNLNIDDFFSVDGEQTVNGRNFSYQPLNTIATISFKESVMGVNKEISYKKYSKCTTCNAKGSQSIGNGCETCNGFGRIVSNNKGMVYTKVCNKCFGKDIKVKACDPCASLGVIEISSNITIHIPPGTIGNSTLRLRGAGHYIGSNIFGDACTDVFVFVNVQREEGLTLEGKDVVSHVKLTLLEALTGCSKQVKTIFNIQEIEIVPMSKNKDEIRIPRHGVVSAGGVQRVIFDVEYPENVDALIEILKNKEN